MLFSNISILDEHFMHKSGCYVGVKDGVIAYLGTTPPAEDYGEVYDGAGKLLMPGLYNAHSHSAMTLMRGYGENMVLADWLNQRIYPFEAKMGAQAVYNGAMLAAAEMLRFGVVSTTDMYFEMEANYKAVLESGIKMNHSFGILCFDESGLKDSPIYSQWEQFIPQYHNAGDGRLKIDIGIHAEYTSTPRMAQETGAYAKEKGLRMQLHLSETSPEHEQCKARHGKTPARYFYDLGVFDVPTTAAHCVWLEGEDFDILAEKGVTVGSCPVSNLKLASGFVNAPKLLEKGVNVALGTDSVASNNNLNLFQEIGLFGILFKATTGDPTALTPQQALYAATRAGALSQGREDCGLVKEGFRADLIVLDVNQPHMTPCHDLVNNVVFSAQGSDVCLTMVDGKVLYKNGIYTTIDVEKVQRDAAQSVKEILAAL